MQDSGTGLLIGRIQIDTVLTTIIIHSDRVMSIVRRS